MVICSFALKGYEGFLVMAETDLRRGIPSMEIIGLPDNAVKESKERVRAAIKNSGYEFPREKILINLTPAGLKKEGSIFDLAIALAILQAMNSEDKPFNPNKVLALGELELSGRLRGINGALSAIGGAYDTGIDYFIIPKENMAEAQSICAGRYWAVETLQEAMTALTDIEAGYTPPLYNNQVIAVSPVSYTVDFKDIKGQKALKRALEVAAAGRHNLFFFGPPGCGKTMSCKALETILPPLNTEESLQTSRIYSIKGELQSNLLLYQPFRTPHHSSSTEGIIGGGKNIHPGEASLAHNGVLFLDEAFEFGKELLQNLREPLESKKITLARAGQSVWYPANFQLIMAANVCPCGSLGRNDRACLCSQQEISRYWKRLGGAVLDRVEIRLPAEPVSAEQLLTGVEENSASVRDRVLQAVEIEQKRYSNQPFRYNNELSASYINNFCRLSEKTEQVFILTLKKSFLSSRAAHSILKVARTIADLEHSNNIETPHILEAVSYRRYGDNDLYWADI